MIFLLILAGYYEIDLNQATLDKISYNEQRFPPEYFQDTSQSYAEAYWQLKKERGER